MALDYLLKTFERGTDEDAVIWRDQVMSYGQLMDCITSSIALLERNQIAPGSVVLLEADFSPQSIAMMLALIQSNCIVVPIAHPTPAKREQFKHIGEVEVSITLDEQDQAHIEHSHTTAKHELLQKLKQGNRPGLILFSSGATGQPKAVVHDFLAYLERFNRPGHRLRTLNFLLFDHVAGLNTLFYTLSQAGCVVTVQDRTPESVLSTIEAHRVQLLPTSPTFLNLMLLSGIHNQYDLSSLELVTYGSEVMPESTLTRFREAFPGVHIYQQYGLSEMGVARSKSKSPDSVWVTLNSPEFEVRVRDGMLEVKSASAMLGYLNAESPFTEDGWFKTGDAVEVDGEFFRILGRKSEVINVGGEKVFPIEVENVLLEMNGVVDVKVIGVSNPIIGNMVKATVRLSTSETAAEFSRRMHEFCKDRLLAFQIPQKVVLVNDDMHSERFKKLRRIENE